METEVEVRKWRVCGCRVRRAGEEGLGLGVGSMSFMFGGAGGGAADGVCFGADVVEVVMLRRPRILLRWTC